MALALEALEPNSPYSRHYCLHCCGGSVGLLGPLPGLVVANVALMLD